MKNVNKILYFFILTVFLSFFVIWEVLQSQWVAGKISLLATSYIKEVLDADVEFKNLQFSLFPPGAKIKNIYFKAAVSEVEVAMEVSSLGIYFSPFDVFKTRFTVDNIEVNDGIIRINNKKRLHKEREELGNINLDGFDALGELPLSTASMKNIAVEWGKNSLYIQDLEVSNRRQDLSVLGSFERVKVGSYLENHRLIDRILLEAVIDRHIVDIEKLEIKAGFFSGNLKGVVKNYVSKNINYDILFNSEFPLNELHSWLDFKKIGVLNYGVLSLAGKVKGIGAKYKLTSDVELKDFKTDFAYGDYAQLKLSADHRSIHFENFALFSGKQKLRLLEGFEFYSFEKKKFVEEPILLRAEYLKSDNFLRYIRSTFSMLDMSITGDVRFDLLDDRFTFKVEDELSLSDLKLNADKKFEILSIDNITLNSGFFSVHDGHFLMDTVLRSKESSFSLNAKIGKGDFELSMPTGFLDLSEFERIVGSPLEGKGTFSFTMKENLKKKMVLRTKNDFKKIYFKGYRLDKLKGSVNYLLSENKISFEKLNASSGKTKIAVSGELDYEKLNVSGDYSLENVSFSELKRSLAPIFGKMKLTSNEIHGNWDIYGDVSGGLLLNDVLVKGSVKGRNNYFFEESVDDLFFKYDLKKSIFRLFEFEGMKSRGGITGALQYDFIKNIFEFNADIRDIAISEISYYSNLPFSLASTLYGKVSGRMLKDKWEVDSIFELKKTSLFSEKYGDSLFKVKYQGEKVDLKLNLFGDEIRLSSVINFANAKTRESYINIDLKIPELKSFFGIFGNVDLINNKIEGEVDYSLRSQFDSKTMKVSNLVSNLKMFKLKKEPVNVVYESSDDEILVKNGIVKKWDMNIRGREFYLVSRGKGNINKDYLTTTQIKFDASIVEVLNNYVTRASGDVRGKVVYGSSRGANLYEAFLSSNDMTLSSNRLPVSITKAQMMMSFKSGIVQLEKMNAELTSGSLSLVGEVNLKNIIPDINLRYEFKDAGIPVARKSNLIFSGEGSLIGKNTPYILSGDFYIQKFALVNELSDLKLNARTLSKKEIRYLPGEDSKVGGQLLNFNLNVVTREPVYIRNSLIDLGFLGHVHIQGGEKRPVLSGKVNLAPRSNKILFKNNEFLLSKGNVFFSKRSSYKNPELDFLASASINDVKVSAGLLGPVQNFDFKLRSEPSLSQTDILSLVIFGYTEDLSNNLSDTEKQSMTQAGVGSLIFDSFKVNETLKNEFGLQVNFGTEISKEEGSYLSRRSAEGGSGGGKIHSATKWEVKKQLSDVMSMSVSGTVGASTKQKQSVNLNYKIGENTSFEGVYESTASDEAEVINNDSAVGADLKWKWTFK